MKPTKIKPMKPHKPNKSQISAVFAYMGSKGGKTTGPTKRRTPEQYRKAGLASAAKRWGFKPEGENP